MNSPIRWALVAFALSIFSSGLWADGKAAFTLADSIRAHSTLGLKSKDLVVGKGAPYVAWVEEDGLFVAQEPDFKPRRLVAQSESAQVTAIYPSPDGHSVWYRVGRQIPAFGPYPARDDRQLWRADLRDGSARQFAAGAEVPGDEVAFAPDGRSFVSIDGLLPYGYSIDGERVQRKPLFENDPQHYAAIRLSGLTYSPDGKRLAFVSWRQAGQSYIVLYEFATGAFRYVNPSIHQDTSPAWSPDGKELAFVRTPGNWTREYRFSNHHDGAPWSLMAVNPDKGNLREIWRADTGAGSIFTPFGEGSWMEPEQERPQISWTPSNKILFPWEKTGWISLYAVDAKGGVAKQLTTGNGEVTLPSLSADGKSAVYGSNIGDLARLHLWRVSVDGGTAKQLTRGNGVEHSPKLTAGGQLVYIKNIDGRMPNRRMVEMASGKNIGLTPRASEETQLTPIWRQLVDAQVLPVRAEDGMVSYQQIFVPKGPAPRNGFPVIVSSKGGPNGRISPGNGAYVALGQYAVSQGFIFVDINYRGCFGFGLEYRMPAGRGATGASEELDLKALGEYLRQRPDVDARHIGIMGGSYGGHIVGTALSRLPQYYAAGAHLSGVSDWVLEMKMDQALDNFPSAPSEYIRLSERIQIEDLAFASSPPSRIAAWKGPTLITMGELDRSGHMEGIIDLGYRLLEQGTPVEFWIAPEAGHSGPRARPQDKVMEFFERTLRATP